MSPTGTDIFLVVSRAAVEPFVRPSTFSQEPGAKEFRQSHPPVGLAYEPPPNAAGMPRSSQLAKFPLGMSCAIVCIESSAMNVIKNNLLFIIVRF